MSESKQSEPGQRLSARDLLRAAFVDDQDPRFPWWLLLPGILAALGWAGYQAATGAGSFLPVVFWPGAGIFVLVTIVAFFGWQLDID